MEKHFCCCTVVRCPHHPENHAQGCDPCIKNNLAKKKMPYCFFRAVHDDTSEVNDYSFAGFVAHFRRNCPPAPLPPLPPDELEALAGRNQARAREVIADSGVVAAWEAAGALVNPVGSLPTGLLMKHRDVDFHIYTEELDAAAGFAVMGEICRNPAVKHLEFRNLAATGECCFEWHLQVAGRDGDEWQLDLIQIRKGSTFDGYFERVASRIRAVLTPETRHAILALKYMTPESEKIMGIEYYKAVIGDGVRTYPEFVEWRRRNPVDGIVEWCP